MSGFRLRAEEEEMPKTKAFALRLFVCARVRVRL